MTEVKKIQCPSCGSNSTYKLFDGSYKCNYCQGSFMVNEREQQRPAPVNQTSGSAPAVNSKMIIALALGIFIILGVGMATFYIVRLQTSYDLPGINKHVSMKEAAIKTTMSFAGTAGNVVWIVSEKSCSGDSLCYELLVVDPKTNDLKGKQLIGTSFKSYAKPDLNLVFGNSFWKYGNLAYSIRNDTGLTAYNIYSGKPELTTTSLSGKIPGPAAGILKVQHNPSEKIFKITTTAGDVLRFDPLSQTFIQADKPKGKKEEPVTRELYLSDGLKHHLYVFTKQGDGFPIVFGNYVQEARLPDPGASKSNNVKDIFGNIHIEKVSEKNYFRAQPLLKDTEGNLLLLYKTDLKENSPVILESINMDGKTNWSLRDTLFLNIGKAFASEDLGCDYTFSDDTLIISLGTEEKEYVAIDINTGKILWRFNPKAYIVEHAS